LSDCKVKILNKKGSDIGSISLKYLQHLVSAGHRNGYGVHSPFLYDLVRNVIFNKVGLKVPPEILQWHRSMRRMSDCLVIHDHGAGSRVSSGAERKVAAMVKHASVNESQGALLYRICSWYRPGLVVEFGTGLGISTGYLAAGSGTTTVLTVEGSPEKHLYARDQFPETLAESVEFLKGKFEDHLEMMIDRAGERTIVFIDGDHRYAPTIEKLDRFLNKNLAEILFVMDDIHWSDEMESAWKLCCDHPLVDVSIDLFRMGILIKRPGIAKQHLKVIF
jgi:predicted O-methyltransferase YrrM